MPGNPRIMGFEPMDNNKSSIKQKVIHTKNGFSQLIKHIPIYCQLINL